LKYHRDDVLLCERALTDPDHAPHYDEIRARMAQARIEVERLEFEIQVAEIKGEMETNKSTIELHVEGLRQCNKRIVDLLDQLDDVRNNREYRQSDEHRAGLSFNETMIVLTLILLPTTSYDYFVAARTAATASTSP
jgi:hypothetical protein